MANFIHPLPLFSLTSPTPLISAASSSSSSSTPAPDVIEEDSCSICLDPFSNHNPSTVTNCNHEYHLQCILEWSQRSKECPICWQLLSLKDPAGQELLAAIDTEKRLRRTNIISNAPHFHNAFHVEQDSCSDDSDFDERIMQHIAIAASRARYIRRRERHRSSGHGPSHVLVFASPVNTPDKELEHPAEDSAPTSNVVLPVENHPHLPSMVPPMENVVTRTAVDRDGPFKPRIVFRKPTSDACSSPSSSEVLSFSDSIKSKWLAASARYKESFSKGTKGIKEKLLARNSSVKELSKGVQREMSAGIAGVARMIERLDLSSKRTGSSSPPSGFAGETNLSSKGKGVQVNIITEELNQRSEEVANVTVLTASSHISNTSPGRLEVSQGGH